MEWNQPTIEQRENICYNCNLFLAGVCDGFDEDIKECVDYSDYWIAAKE